MKLNLRIARSIVLLFAGILAIVLNKTMEGYAVVFGLCLIVVSALTLLFVFFNFDKNINQKVVMEMIMDGFSGLVLFTYPISDQNFFLIVFAFWIVMMGVMLVTSGMMDKSKKELLWVYLLSGIALIVLGFVVMHYEAAYRNSVLYFVGFTMMIYSGTNLYLFLRKKQEIY